MEYRVRDVVSLSSPLFRGQLPYRGIRHRRWRGNKFCLESSRVHTTSASLGWDCYAQLIKPSFQLLPSNVRSPWAEHDQGERDR